jgi:hypothetical protein
MTGSRARPDWEGLQHGISGQVALPGSEAYQQAGPPLTIWLDDIKPRTRSRLHRRPMFPEQSRGSR